MVTFVFWEFSRGMYDLTMIAHFTSKGYCDVIDEKAYSQKRAESFSEIKNKEYKEYLENLKK